MATQNNILPQICMLAVAGHTNVEIAQMLGLGGGNNELGGHGGGVSKALKSPEGKKLYTEMRSEQLKLIHETVVGKAFQVAEEMLDGEIEIARKSENEQTKLRAIQDVLDRIGMRKQEDAVIEQTPFIQVNIQMNKEEKEGLMPVRLAQGGDGSNGSYDSEESHSECFWTESQQRWQGKGTTEPGRERDTGDAEKSACETVRREG